MKDEASMWNKKMKCKVCGEAYRGHPASRYCCDCREKAIKKRDRNNAQKSLKKKEDKIIDKECQRILGIIKKRIEKWEQKDSKGMYLRGEFLHELREIKKTIEEV